MGTVFVGNEMKRGRYPFVPLRKLSAGRAPTNVEEPGDVEVLSSNPPQQCLLAGSATKLTGQNVKRPWSASHLINELNEILRDEKLVASSVQ